MRAPVTVSAAMIVRNEQGFLPGCLESLRGRVDEIIVVDTGSTDDTVDIAAKAGVRLLHLAWTQDFAAARNVALDAVTSDWVLYIDADERLNLPQGGVLSDYIDHKAIAGFVRFRPKTGYTRYREWRLFRNDIRLRFKGRIHETIVPAIREVSDRDSLPIVQTAVEINHLGYDGDQSHKHGRNLELLEQAVRTNPDRTYYWYHMAETLAALGRLEEAAAAAAEGLASARRVLSDEQRCCASMIYQYLVRAEMERRGNPLPIIDEALEQVPENHALRFQRAHALLDAGHPLEALAIAESLRAVDPDSLSDGLLSYDQGIFTDKACELAALACLRLGRRPEAAAHFATAFSLAPHDFSYRVKAVALGGSPGAKNPAAAG